MAANKVIFVVVALASVALFQINARPAENDWMNSFENALKNLSSKVTEMVGDPSQYANMTKNSWNTFSDNLKNDLSSITKSFDGKTGVSDVIKEATNKWQSAVDTYSLNSTADAFNPQKLKEKLESLAKEFTQNAPKPSN